MIKLLIVDDSPLMRQLLTGIFTASGDFDVAVAKNGAEALERLHAFAPDVVTLDIHMPGMNGLDCLDRIMIERPCPVVMVAALTSDGADETLEAMQLGAVDFIAKPSGAVSLEIDALAPELVDRVRNAVSARISLTTRLRERVRLRAAGGLAPVPARRARARPRPVPRQFAGTADGLVLIGCSTGGPPALDTVLGLLPANFPWPIVIAQHMPASFTGSLARRLDRLSELTVVEVERTIALEPGFAYIAKGDADVMISRRADSIVAMPAPRSEGYFWHPSVDLMVESAMRVVEPERLIGVLMTGMGNDGAEAMARLNRRGGHTIAESNETAVVWGMPGALVEKSGAGDILPLERIAGALMARLAA